MIQTSNLQSNSDRRNSEEGNRNTADDDSEIGDSERDQDSVTMGSFVKVDRENSENTQDSGEIPEDTDEPDYYHIDVLTWDFQVTTLLILISLKQFV